MKAPRGSRRSNAQIGGLLTIGTHYVIINGHSKLICWSEEKNALLTESRGVGFERAAVKIEQLDYIALVEHWNRRRYPHQWVFVLEIDGYAYYVPFVETDDKIFLKTMMPSRQAKRRYLRGN
ncbi:MAG: toxin [Elusimicrobiota bacterium]